MQQGRWVVFHRRGRVGGGGSLRAMVFNVILVLFVEETGISRENHRPAASHCQTLSHNVVSSTPHHE